MKRRPLCLICFFLILFLYVLDLTGLCRFRENPLPKELRYRILSQKEATICGEIVRCTERADSRTVYLKHTYLKLTPDEEETAIHPVSFFSKDKIYLGNIQVFLKGSGELLAGMNVRVKGTIKEFSGARNPGGFDSMEYYACRHMYYQMLSAEILDHSEPRWCLNREIEKIRKVLLQKIEICAGDEASFFEAILLGNKENLEEEAKLEFQRAGMLHILTISGLHISILGSGLFQAFLLLGTGMLPAGILSFFAMLFYGMLTGSGAAVLRAVVMFILETGSRMLGRSFDPENAIAIAGILLLLDSPAWLFSSSFLLSFSAALGIFAAVPILKEGLGHVNRYLAALFQTFALQITMLPVILFFYGEFSLIGILLNFLLLPMAGLILLSGLMMIWGSLFLEPLGMLLAVPGRLLFKGYQAAVEIGIRFPMAVWITGVPSRYQIIEAYLIWIGFLTWLWYEKHRKKGKKEQKQEKVKEWWKRLLFLLVIGIELLILSPKKDENLHITCLDVGQGDCAVLQLPDGKNFLVDCGSSSERKAGMDILLPFLKAKGIAHLDGVFISHADQDHINGIEEFLQAMEKNLTGIQIKTIFLADDEENEIRSLIWQAEKNKIRIQKISAGDVLVSGDTKIRILWPGKMDMKTERNDQSLVFEVKYGVFEALFTGDISTETEEKILKYAGEVDFLKVAHHGSRYSSGEAFLSLVRPKISVISCAEKNSYGHPAPETVERLEAISERIYYTMKQGAILLQTDGEHLWMETYRKEQEDLEEQNR